MRYRLYVCLGLLLGLAESGLGGNAADDEQMLKDARIATDGAGLLAFFKQRTVATTDEAKIRALVKQLGHDDFNKREDASQQIVAIGARARPALRQAVGENDIEVVRRAQDCLKKIEQGATASVIAAGVRTLARQKPAGTVEVLLGYLPSAEDEIVAEEVRVALASVAVREGKVEPALLAALKDPLPAKRAAAAVALCRSNAPGQMAVIRKMLQDADPVVQMRVALALAALREKDVVPVMIGLLGKLQSRERGQIEDLLYRLAGDKAPTLAPGDDPASLRRYAEAWQAWWKEAEPKFDAARLGEATRTLNYTMIVLLDQGRIIDLDDRNQPRWQIDGLQFPLDAQLLPGDRVLVAEYEAGRVTERTKKNEIVWEKKIESPLVAQRLANGSTFIATRTNLLELDKDGKEVFNFTRPGGELIMKAQKLRNGDIALVTQLGVTRFVRLDPTGKEIKSFGVDLRSSGGRIDVLSNGHVLAPEMLNNRVVEHDADGKVVWDVTVEQPIAAVRLPNGNTLITSMKKDQNRAIEVDRAGKEVWSYKTSTRVTRAFRR